MTQETQPPGSGTNDGWVEVSPGQYMLSIDAKWIGLNAKSGGKYLTPTVEEVKNNMRQKWLKYEYEAILNSEYKRTGGSNYTPPKKKHKKRKR